MMPLLQRKPLKHERHSSLTIPASAPYLNNVCIRSGVEGIAYISTMPFIETYTWMTQQRWRLMHVPLAFCLWRLTTAPRRIRGTY